MSDDAVQPLDPAIALVEFESIAAGIVAGDAMVKSSPLGSIYAGTVHPGKYLVFVSGDTASVEEALSAVHTVVPDAIVDIVFLPDIHPAVSDAIASSSDAAAFGGEALGIVETSTAASVINAADAGIKAARVELIAIGLADGLGGKGYALFSGPLGEVDAAVSAAVERAEIGGRLLHHRVVAQLHGEMAHNLRSGLTFLKRLRSHRDDTGG